MTKIIEKYLEAVTLTDPATVTLGQAQTPVTQYEYTGVFSPLNGYGILRGLIQNQPFSPAGLGTIAATTPNGPNVIINSNTGSVALVVTLTNVITTPSGSAVTITLGVGNYGTCTIPKEWWTPTSTITIGQTTTPSTGPSSNPTATPYVAGFLTNVDILFWS